MTYLILSGGYTRRCNLRNRPVKTNFEIKIKYMYARRVRVSRYLLDFAYFCLKNYGRHHRARDLPNGFILMNWFARRNKTTRNRTGRAAAKRKIEYCSILIKLPFIDDIKTIITR